MVIGEVGLLTVGERRHVGLAKQVVGSAVHECRRPVRTSSDPAPRCAGRRPEGDEQEKEIRPARASGARATGWRTTIQLRGSTGVFKHGQTAPGFHGPPTGCSQGRRPLAVALPNPLQLRDART